MSGEEAAIDSNAYVAIQMGDEGVMQAIISFKTLVLPVVVLGELTYGALASGRPEENQKRVSEFARDCTLLEVTEAVSNRYAEIRLQLRAVGRPIPDNDAWIAASCVEAGVPLITRDSHFDHVSSLKVIKW